MGEVSVSLLVEQAATLEATIHLAAEGNSSPRSLVRGGVASALRCAARKVAEARALLVEAQGFACLEPTQSIELFWNGIPHCTCGGGAVEATRLNPLGHHYTCPCWGDYPRSGYAE